MTRGLTLSLLAGGGALALGAAPPPSALDQAHPGLWEVSGAPGTSVLIRQCVADIALLARYEHRAAANCSAHTVRNSGSEISIDYSCGPAGFGHSDVTVLTPRSLRIATQGISSGLPFNYVLQARRMGECPLSQRH